jgi:hypothetical protein
LLSANILTNTLRETLINYTLILQSFSFVIKRLISDIVCSRWFQYINYHIENKCRNISLSCWFPCKRLYLSVNEIVLYSARVCEMSCSLQQFQMTIVC